MGSNAMTSILVICLGKLAETAAEIRDSADPAKELLDVVHRRVLHRGRAEMVRRVLQHHPEIFEVEAIAECALDAHIGGDPDEHDVADAPRAERRIELRVEE